MTSTDDESSALSILPRLTWSKRWLILAFALVFAGFGFLFALTRVELYRASTLVEIGQNDNAVLDLNTVFGTSPRDGEDLTVLVSNESRILESASVLQEVVQTQRLVTDPYFNPGHSPASTLEASDSIERRAASGASEEDEAMTLAQNYTLNQIMLRRLRSAVEIEQLGYSGILRLSVTADDPDKAARLANATVEAYLTLETEKRLDVARGTVEWLTVQLQELENKMQASANAVDEFRREHGLGDDTQNIALSGTFRRLQENFIEAAAQRKAAEDQLNRTKSAAVAPDNATLAALEQTLESSTLRESAIGKSLAQAEDRFSRVTVAQSQLVQLERKADADALIFERFLEQVRQTNAIGELATSNVRIVEPASPPLKPIGFGNKAIITMAWIAGGAIGTVAVLFLELLRRRVVSRDELESLTGLQVISVIPRLPKKDRDQNALLGFILSHPYSTYAEALRSIGYRILSRNSERSTVVAITSSIPGEGKSSISLALTLFYTYFHEKRVVLVDCDFRCSQLSRELQLGSLAHLGAFLVGKASVSQVIQTDPIYNLQIVPSCGKLRASPDALSNERFRELIETLKKSFDIIILDTPPIAPVQDIGMVKHLCDEVFFVVSGTQTTRNQITQAQKKLRALDVSVSGVIFNAVDLEKEALYRGVSYRSYSEYYDA
ncbi:MAG: polysaccharide biosynthesis tyrosine autokinase [Pseudomonadota bacterium]